MQHTSNSNSIRFSHSAIQNLSDQDCVSYFKFLVEESMCLLSKLDTDLDSSNPTIDAQELQQVIETSDSVGNLMRVLRGKLNS